MKNDPPSVIDILHSVRRIKCPGRSWQGVASLIFLLHFSASPVLAEKDDFEHPNSFIGNAGWSGGLERWVEIADVPVGNGVCLPLRLRFASDVTRESPLFGGNWWCPLLECEGKAGPDYLEYTTFGGGRRFLLKSEGWRSKDGVVSGRETDDVLEIESRQWRYRFQSGRIQEAITPDGKCLKWRYVDGKVSGVFREGDGAEVLTVERTAGRVKVHGEFGDFVFREESEKSWLKFPDGREEEIEIAPEGGGVSRMTVVSRPFAGGAPKTGNFAENHRMGMMPLMEFRWKDGALVSDSDFTYEIRRTDTGEDILHRVDRKGRTEWYTFDMDRGLATYKRQDGSRVQSWYYMEHGPRYMKCFRMDTLSKDQALVSSRLLTYDGNVEKEWIEQGPAALEKGGRYIAPAEAEQLHGQIGVLFLDARKPGEYDRGHIPGAVHLGRASFEADYPVLENRLKAAETLVVYCTSRQCEDSSIVATRLSQMGYDGVLIFEGGWAEWWKRHR